MTEAGKKFDILVTGKTTEIESRREKIVGQQKHEDNTWYYFGLVGEIGFAIALPIAAGGIGGAYVDKILGIAPKATILFLLVGIGISFIGFFHIVEEVFHKRIH